MSITKFEVPGAPAEMAAQMKKTMGEAQTTTFCLTKEMSDKGFEEMFRELGKDGECKYQRFDVSGGKLDALLQCESKAEGKGAVALSGNVGSTGSDATVRSRHGEPGIPDGQHRDHHADGLEADRGLPGGEINREFDEMTIVKNVRAMFFASAAVLALGLGACNSQEGVTAKDASVEDVAKAIANSDVALRPGRWETSVAMAGKAMPAPRRGQGRDGDVPDQGRHRPDGQADDANADGRMPL